MIISIDKDLCTGCQECIKVCPAYAIEGEAGKPHDIKSDKCVMCGQCVQVCKSYASIIDKGFKFVEEKRKERNLPDTIKAVSYTHLSK